MENKDRRPLHEIVAQDLIARLERGTAPWQKPWVDGRPEFQLPYNALTGNRYRGINMLSLMMKDRDDPRWMTFKQASSMELKVRRGEKASLVQFVKVSELKPKKDEKGNAILDRGGKPVQVEIPLARPLVSNAWVFNAAQIEGIEPLQAKVPLSQQWSPQQRAESLIAATGADIIHLSGDRAFYSLAQDRITMPMPRQFESADSYYSTLLHELGHWTGHKDRLDRGLMNTFGNEQYAREELRAEIASMLVGQELQIGHDPDKHASYVQSWIKLLRTNPFEIHNAAADAERIFRYLLAYEHKREISQALSGAEQPVKPNRRPQTDALSIGEQIDYKQTSYKVLGQLKRGRFRIEDLQSGNVMAVSKNDGLYQSLLAARDGARKVQPGIVADQDPTIENTLSQAKKIGR